MANRAQRAYARRIRELIEGAGRLEGRARRRGLRLLREAHENIVAKVATAGTDFERFSTRELERAVGDVMGEWSRKYGSDLSGYLSGAAEARAEGYLAAITDLGVDVSAVPRIPISVVEVAQGYTAELVEGLSREAAKRINSEIRLGVLGQKTPAEVIDALGRTIRDPGPFRTVGARAETIARTELARVNQTAGQARIRQMAEVADLQKQWLASFVQRAEHMAAHGQRRRVDEAYSVGGEALQYPLDPAGSAENTVNCSCNSVPWVPALEDTLAESLGDVTEEARACAVHGPSAPGQVVFAA